MNILGINGWNNWFHDASAVLIRNDVLVAACEEERFTRNKHACSSPINAVRWCLTVGQIDWDELDAICVGWDLNFYNRLSNDPLPDGELAKSFLSSIYAPKDFPTEKVHFLEHHLCHAYSIVPLSPGKDGIVVIIDGQGEEESITVYDWRDRQLNKLYSFGADHSLGYFYEAGAVAAGFGLTGTGKLMGLSSYGISEIDFFVSSPDKNHFELNYPSSSQLASFSDDLDDAKRVVDGYWLPLFYNLYDGLPKINDHADIVFETRNSLHLNNKITGFAASIQQSFEYATEFLLERFIQQGINTFFLAGGAALNCKSNGRLVAKNGLDLNVQPLSNDAGVALGAALSYSARKGCCVDFGDFPFVGPEYGDKEIKTALKEHDMVFECIEIPWIVGAELIAQGNIIGWFQGKAEVGPRALGARSILAMPNSFAIRDKINREIKGRERWRPFGPSVLEEEASKYFNQCEKSRYMMIACNALGTITKRLFAGALHIDDTARVQTVPKDYPNQSFRFLLESFHRITGIPGVLNTSFNRAGEPIVNSPEDAVRTFRATGLDAMIIGNYLVRKKK